MSNIFDDMRAAVRDARQTIRAADYVASDLALLLCGRLRHVSSTDALRTLKRELRDFDMTTNDKVLVPRELLPCPFCGCKPRLRHERFESAHAYYFLACTGPEQGKCDVGPSAAAKTRVAVLTTWNMRHNS